MTPSRLGVSKPDFQTPKISEADWGLWPRPLVGMVGDTQGSSVAWIISISLKVIYAMLYPVCVGKGLSANALSAKRAYSATSTRNIHKIGGEVWLLR